VGIEPTTFALRIEVDEASIDQCETGTPSFRSEKLLRISALNSASLFSAVPIPFLS
jgi:hypothetical protein